jgi:Putative Ig domain
LVLQEATPNFSRSAPRLYSALKSFAALGLIGVSLNITPGCGGSTLSRVIQTAALIQVSISPSTATVNPSAQQRFTAAVSGTSNSAVNWVASAGSISSDGTFTAPANAGGAPIIVTATSLADSTQHATGVVSVVAALNLTIANTPLNAGVTGTPYGATLSATGGTTPYGWSVSGGALPAGIQLQSNGSLAGTPSQPGSYSFTVTVTDSASHKATQNFTLPVSLATSTGTFDGPAELPRVYLQTTMADTPAPGSLITVNSGSDLQSALNGAECGDTIQLQAGATFGAQIYTFPNKSCDDQHWIIVRTSTPDAQLPPEGTRMTPCYTGVASLPGRPSFNCSNPQHLLATITFSGGGSGPVFFADGANHYRLLGLEVTRVVGSGKSVTALVGPVMQGTMSQIVLDRMYIHGSPLHTEDTRRGVELSGGTSIAVQDSYISELHCAVQGTCSDSQAVSGGDGSLATGPIKIDNNFLESSGENIIFGGGSATQSPADIEIRFNHFFKPMFWLAGQPGFTAPAFIVKNHFELKNAQRVLFDSNMLEDDWGGFSQNGYSIVLTPKNQGNATGNVCPLCQVTDVTIRYVAISHVAGGFQIANTVSPPLNAVPLAGERYSIHDVIIDDVQRDLYVGFGNFAQVSTTAQPVLQSVMINHVTAFAPHELFNVGAPTPTKMTGFTFTNSIVLSGTYPMWSTGAYGTSDCANADVPLTIMNSCFSGYNFSYNAILSAPTEYSPSKWPAGNWFYSTPQDLDFVNYNNGDGGDYHLLPSSPAKGAASDGGDLGANVDAVLAAISGIQ